MKTHGSFAVSDLARSALLTLMMSSAAFGDESALYGQVVGVIDGDTLKVLVDDQRLVRVRLAFCDAPEKRQAFGNRSKQAMSELVFGKEIELRPHSIDRYGRTVAQVIVNGEDVGVAMLRLGLVWVYDRYITEAPAETKGRYQTARDEAKNGRLGLWSDPNSVPPWIFRHLAKADQERALASKWMEANRGSTPQSSELVSPIVSQAPSSPGEVWVNTKSGKYWKPGSLFYGKTKRGEYMTEELAVRGGYRPANRSGE